MTKRKAEKQQPAAPLSAVAARKARQEQAQAAAASASNPPQTDGAGEPPSKKLRHSPEDEKSASQPQPAAREEIAQPRRSARQKKDEGAKNVKTPVKRGKGPNFREQQSASQTSQTVETEDPSGEEESEGQGDDIDEENNGVGGIAPEGDNDGYESPADTPAQVQEFPLSKTRLNKHNIVYSDEHTLCVRIKEKMSLVFLGHYDLWVKRGVISLMGAKLHPSPQVYRVYAPSTHSLPVIKCVAGVDGAAEIEVKSCHSGIYRLRDLSPLYQRIWNSGSTAADKLTLKKAPQSSKRTFSVLYTSADDSLKRHLRPLHLEKQWSSAIKSLSQRGGRLRALVCGPKASGKSTFSRYLLNHLLSPAPQTETNHYNTDGVAFLDLDPGQPEFSPMGQAYLVHLRSPVFGPPFSHPSLDDSRTGTIIRAHHIGASSPREDPEHYMLAAMDLMDRYRALLASYPQCPLIINYPGWIFGLGLEVAIWLIQSLGLSDVIYMSEKGPSEVVDPLSQAARSTTPPIPLTTLPSQPTDFVTRSSAQLRAMQMQSYFHMSYPPALTNPVWSDTPVSRTRPFHVNYAGPRQGIRGIMVMGSQISPDLLHDVLEGSIVGVVALESPTAVLGLDQSTSTSPPPPPPQPLPETANGAPADNDDSDVDVDMAETHTTHPHPQTSPSSSSSLNTSITRTANENLPHLFVGSGSCNPLDPRASRCLGLALVRSIDVSAQQLELVTPIPGPRIRDALATGHGLVLVRGQLDNPNWAISEDYYAARAAEKRHREARMNVERSGRKGGADGNADADADADAEVDAEEERAWRTKHARVSALLRDRVKRASEAPWMRVVEDSGRQQMQQQQQQQRGATAAQREKSLWKLRKKAYPGSESEGD